MGWPDRVRGALGRVGWETLPDRVVVVDVVRQRFALLVDGAVVLEDLVSTGAAGVGGEPGSNRTPPGWHRIAARIGDGQAPGTVFRSRVPSGDRWTGERVDDDLILTRILTLDGLEDRNLHSLARFVYLHGTNAEDRLGEPVSHGCVRLSNAGITALFDRVREGDPVLILDA